MLKISMKLCPLKFYNTTIIRFSFSLLVIQAELEIKSHTVKLAESYKVIDANLRGLEIS